MRILLATDGSTNADVALNVVLHRPWEDGTVVKVITVVEPLHSRINKVIGLFGLAKTAEEAQKRLFQVCKDLMKRYKDALDEKFGAANVSAEIVEGRPREKIVEIAKEWNADVVMLGAHGHSRSESTEFLHGVVPEFVLAHAPCSVELVRLIAPRTMVTEIQRKQPVEEDKYLVALDDSECSAATLNAILARKWPAGCYFNLISIAETLTVQAYSGLGPWEGAGSEEYAELVERTTEAEHNTAEKVLADAAEKIRAAFPDAHVTAEILEGYPRDRIVSFAKEWPADLLIVGSHGRGGIAQFVLGSVSKAAAVHAPCSVLIVRAPSSKG